MLLVFCPLSLQLSAQPSQTATEALIKTLQSVPARLTALLQAVEDLKSLNPDIACVKGSGNKEEKAQCIGRILGKLPSLQVILAQFIASPQSDGLIVQVLSLINQPQIKDIISTVKSISSAIWTVLDALSKSSSSLAQVLGGITIPADTSVQELNSKIAEAGATSAG